MVAMVDATMIFWYNPLDYVSDSIMPSSTKLVIQRRRNVENRTAISLTTDAPMKQRMYFGSLAHSAHISFVIVLILLKPLGGSAG